MGRVTTVETITMRGKRHYEHGGWSEGSGAGALAS
jgi:hypothetical protein